ncbi:MAG TPA: transketolase C-terminal domain-containing protein [Chloroflexota bacterium]|nr:transketolase C-terminal domain-containing protein [Chloroflexota bacterium]
MINPAQHLNPKLFAADLEQVPSRNGYGDGLVQAGAEDPRIVALSADLTESTRTEAFKERFPERFVEVGVAEQNLVTVASGMAAVGKVPFTTSYAMFSPGRNWEQIRTTVCYNDQPVKIVGSHAGVSVGPDGATHQALEDIAITRVLPNMVVVCPTDALEAKRATLAIARTAQPSYLRLSRAKVPLITTEETPFAIGRAEVYWDGDDVAIIACGQMVYRALLAARDLAAAGIAARVINCHTIKPLDEATLVRAAEETGAIVTVEEHQVAGGLGSAVAELVVQRSPVPMQLIGVQDRFGESGAPDELLAAFGLTAEAIREAAVAVVARKRRGTRQVGAG